MQSNLKLVIFDLDGTLADLDIDWEGMHSALAKAKEKQNKIFEQYELANISKAKPIRRNIELLKAFSQMECKIALFTSNTRKAAISIISQNQIGNKVNLIVAREDVHMLKPSPEGLRQILKHFSMKKEEALFIGNNWRDEEAGRRAGIKTIITCDSDWMQRKYNRFMEYLLKEEREKRKAELCIFMSEEKAEAELRKTWDKGIYKV